MSDLGDQRLLVLANYLEAIDSTTTLQMHSWFAHSFDQRDGWDNDVQADAQALAMDDVFISSLPDDQHEVLTDPHKLATECGFAACAIGHACSIPAFQEAGFRLEADHKGADPFIASFAPSFNGQGGYPAVEEFFGMSRLFVMSIFGPDAYQANYVKPAAVAKKIRRYLQLGNPEA